MRGLREPSLVFLPVVMVQYWLIQCLQHENQLCMCLLAQVREHRELSVDIFGTWRMKPGTHYQRSKQNFPGDV